MASQDDYDWFARFISSEEFRELQWWRLFSLKCFNRIPVGTPLLEDRFKVMVQNPFTEEWENVWKPSVVSSTAEITQLDQEQ